MSNPIQTPEQIRTAQRDALALVDELITGDAPVISVWRIGQGTHLIEGYIDGIGRPEADVRAEMNRWAEYLGTSVTQVDYPPDTIQLVIDVTINEIAIEIFTTITDPARLTLVPSAPSRGDAT